ncbi:MAG TPA: efflux RND transporter permease subunit [Clostridia bacterium]|jgi:HAE1 family hydrophobic/amphiphilic exporter-1|nr:efflux RND transporter permease subunit [Clostridia bacterium]
MNLTELSIKRPVTISMVILVIVVLGAVSFSRLSIDLLPDMNVPVALVYTSYSGSGPQEVETMVTRPIEEVISTVSNIDTLTSVSSEGASMVVAQFNWGTDMDFATLEMREKVDLIKGMLPDGAEEPQIMKIDPSMIPVMQVGVTAGEDQAALKQYAEDVIKSRLERIEGVASVNITGGLERQILIEVNPQQLQNYGLSMQQLAQALTLENMNLPVGQVERGQNELLVRTIGEFSSVEDIGNVLVSLPRGGQVYLKEIATISDTFKDVTSYTRVDGRPTVGLTIQKQSGANTVKVSEKVHKEIAKLEKEASFNLKFNVVMDSADYIKMAIDSVTNNAVVGAVLAVLVLLVFLRNLRTTFIIGLSIPISIVATFILVYFADLTLNMMTLGGLALGVGMLVDNSIVVLENIFRFRQEGYSLMEAAKLGTGEVGMAVAASTLTTIAVFLPVVFVEGLVSSVFKELALTITFSLLASLLVAMTIVPMLSSKLLKVNGANGNNGDKKKSSLSKRFNDWLERFNKKYQEVLGWALDHRKRVIIYAVIAFVGACALTPLVGMDFFPATDEGQFTINIELPQGRALEHTNEVVSQIEELVAKNVPEVESIMSQVGGGSGLSYSSGGSNTGSVSVRLVPKGERKRSTEEIVEALRQETQHLAGAEITFSTGNTMSMGMGTGAALQVKVKGDELDQLWSLAEEVEAKIKEVPGTREVANSFGEGQPEYQIRINRDKAASYGLNTTTVASVLRNAVSGQTVTKLKEEGQEIDIRIQVGEEQRKHLDNLLDLPISSPIGVQIPLRDLAEVVEGQGPNQIERENQTRVITVTAQVQGRDLGSVSKEVEAKIKGINLPNGYFIEFGGQNVEMMEAFSDLGLALILAVILVYMIMAAQFESLIHPLTIMFSLPLAFIGVVLGLLVTRRTLSIPAFIGCIMLAGIVVNNAIVLVDYINNLRSRGMGRREAIMQAGPTRLRPILMTTLTTVLGLLPLTLGIGEGSELDAPLATVVSAGLIFSTVLTLVFIPVVYTIFEDVVNKLKNKLLGRGKDEVVRTIEG